MGENTYTMVVVIVMGIIGHSLSVGHSLSSDASQVGPHSKVKSTLGEDKGRHVCHDHSNIEHVVDIIKGPLNNAPNTQSVNSNYQAMVNLQREGLGCMYNDKL